MGLREMGILLSGWQVWRLAAKEVRAVSASYVAGRDFWDGMPDRLQLHENAAVSNLTLPDLRAFSFAAARPVF
jgi:hypothetical protein